MPETSLLPAGWQVPGLFRRRLGARVGRQRMMVADGHLLLVLHAPPKPDDVARHGRFFWRSPEGNWTSNEQGTGIHALNKHLDQFEEIIADLDRREEAATTADDYFAVLERLAPIYRSMRNTHQTLDDARKQCPDYHDLIDIRDRAYGIERTAELLFEETKNSLDYAVAKRAEEQARASQRVEAAAHRLNVLVALFFPIATLSAVLGMDLQTVAAVMGMDLDELLARGLTPMILFGVLVIGLLLGFVLMAIIARPSPSPPHHPRQPDKKS